MYALVVDNAVQSVGRLPNSARRLDNRAWVMGLANAPTALVEACGYFPVTDEPPTYGPATEVLERGDVTLVAGVPTVQYTVRAKTADEIAAEADETDRRAKGVNVGQAVNWLRTHADQYQAAPNVTTNAQALAAINTLRADLPVLFDGLADLLEWLKADKLGEA